MRRLPHLTRRTFLLGTALGGAGALGPLAGTPARASVPAAEASVQIGPYRVTALLDASGGFGTAGQMFSGASSEDWERAREIDPDAFGANDAWLLDFRCYLVRGPRGRLTLVDTGVGPEGSPSSGWAPVPGRLDEALAAVGVSPSDIDTVVLSHLHEDHYGGSVRLDGTPVFDRARYIVQRTELESLSPDGAAVRYLVEPLRATGQLDVVDGETRLGPPSAAATGVRVVPTPGHTVGHQSVVVDGGRHRLVITGDVLVHAVQLVNPDAAYYFERDKELARRTRRNMLASAHESGALLATAHLHVPFITVE
ncbi:MAG TPA: MBL fold metallo-hydrolase [Jiangellaceae bacterium]